MRIGDSGAFGGRGAAAGLGGLGGGTSTRGRWVSTFSVKVQVNGGRSCRMPITMSSSSASTKKRFQLMLTSQLP